MQDDLRKARRQRGDQPDIVTRQVHKTFGAIVSGTVTYGSQYVENVLYKLDGQSHFHFHQVYTLPRIARKILIFFRKAVANVISRHHLHGIHISLNCLEQDGIRGHRSFNFIMQEFILNSNSRGNSTSTTKRAYK